MSHLANKPYGLDPSKIFCSITLATNQNRHENCADNCAVPANGQDESGGVATQARQPDGLSGEPRAERRRGEYDALLCQLSAGAGAGGRHLVEGVQWLRAAGGQRTRHAAHLCGWHATDDAAGSATHRQLHRQLPEHNKCPRLFRVLCQTVQTAAGQHVCHLGECLGERAELNATTRWHRCGTLSVHESHGTELCPGHCSHL